MIKISRDGFVFEVENDAELQIVLSAFSKNTKGVSPKSDSSKPIPDKSTFLKLYNDMSDNAQKLVNTLKGQHEGVNVSKLSELGLRGSILGGTRGAITKLANKMGIKPEDVIRTDTEKNPQIYYLGEKMWEAIK
jgi:hypothetical protein